MINKKIIIYKKFNFFNFFNFLGIINYLLFVILFLIYQKKALGFEGIIKNLIIFYFLLLSLLLLYNLYIFVFFIFGGRRKYLENFITQKKYNIFNFKIFKNIFFLKFIINYFIRQQKKNYFEYLKSFFFKLDRIYFFKVKNKNYEEKEKIYFFKIIFKKYFEFYLDGKEIEYFINQIINFEYFIKILSEEKSEEGEIEKIEFLKKFEEINKEEKKIKEEINLKKKVNLKNLKEKILNFLISYEFKGIKSLKLEK